MADSTLCTHEACPHIFCASRSPRDHRDHCSRSLPRRSSPHSPLLSSAPQFASPHSPRPACRSSSRGSADHRCIMILRKPRSGSASRPHAVDPARGAEGRRQTETFAVAPDGATVYEVTPMALRPVRLVYYLQTESGCARVRLTVQKGARASGLWRRRGKWRSGGDGSANGRRRSARGCNRACGPSSGRRPQGAASRSTQPSGGVRSKSTPDPEVRSSEDP